MQNATYRVANVLLVRAILSSTPYFKICLTLQLCLGISAILSNSIVLGFYIRQKAGVVSTMYRFLSSCDLLTGLSSFLYIPALCLINNGDAGLDVIYFALQTVSIVTIITAKVSIFYNVVLAVIRTITVRHPFFKIQLPYVLGSAVIYTAIWVIIALAFFIYEPSQITRLNSHDLATMFITQLHPAFNTHNKKHFSLLAISFLGIPLILPTGIVIACFILQTMTHTRPMRRLTYRHRQVTITILLITLLACLCNTPYSIYLIIHYVSNGEIMNLRVIYAFCTTLLHVNAALNPIILILRGRAIRKFILTRACAQGVVTNSSEATSHSAVPFEVVESQKVEMVPMSVRNCYN